MHVFINHRLCTGCGLCGEICPEVFTVTEYYYAFLRVKAVPPEAEECCLKAASQCPLAAITINGGGTFRQIGSAVRDHGRVEKSQ